MVRAAWQTDGLRVSVTDQGPGLDPGELEHLFERFYRGRAARRRHSAPAWASSITRGLLSAAGGRIWAENAPGAGARFSLVVPGRGPRRRRWPRSHGRAHPHRRRRAEHHRHGGAAAARAGLRRVLRDDRTGGARDGGPRQAGSDRAGPRPAGHRRRRCVRGGAAVLERADPGAVRARRRGRQGARAGCRGRRLRHEAVRRRGAAGAHPRRAAAGRRVRRRRASRSCAAGW